MAASLGSLHGSCLNKNINRDSDGSFKKPHKPYTLLDRLHYPVFNSFSVACRSTPQANLYDLYDQQIPYEQARPFPTYFNKPLATQHVMF